MNSTDLPIAAFEDEIVRTVRDNAVTIIVAETGAGKSTQVPWYLYKAGYLPIVTQPRRLAARGVATRVAEERGCLLGGIVGFRTAVAEESCDSPQTEILYVTDGLQLARHLNGHLPSEQHVVILDEVHEANLNMEILMALLAQGHKIVLMSATLEAERMSAYFGGAPVIRVPGRPFTLDRIQSKERPAKVAADWAPRGKNVLVFAPGKAEIEKIIDELDGLVGAEAVVLPLHSELTAEEQDRVFVEYDQPKIVVATNVAQTSITIRDIDVVVDTGLEKRIEMRNGVPGIYIVDISRADCDQRGGRAGRTHHGVYILCSEVSYLDRPLFPVAEILRSSLEQLVLRLACYGIEAASLKFFHQPSVTEIERAKEVLYKLGALDGSGNVTELGYKIGSMPVGVRSGCMLVEAEKRGALDAMVTIVACREVGGILGKGLRDRNRRRLEPRWPRLTDEKDSDLLAELDCFMAALEMSPAQRYRNDILEKRFRAAVELRRRLAASFRIPPIPSSDYIRNDVLRAVVAGLVDCLHRSGFGNSYRGPDGQVRQSDRNSVVSLDQPQWVTGLPFNVGSRAGSDVKVLHLVQSISKVETAWLVSAAPHLVEQTPKGFCYDGKRNEIKGLVGRRLNGQAIEDVMETARDCDEARQALAEALAHDRVRHFDRDFNAEVIVQAQLLHSLYPSEVKAFKMDSLVQLYRRRLGSVYQVRDLHQAKLRLKLSDFVPLAIIRRANKTLALEHRPTSSVA